MKILYGVQGTGNGHLSRARAMAKHFSSQKADVTYLFSGRPREMFFDMDDFGDYELREGFTFSVRNGRVSYLKTLLKCNLRTFIHDLRTLDLGSYDLVLTDFEPVSAWAGRLNKKPVISIGHQSAFHYPVPVEGSNLLSRLVLNYFAPADIHIGLHWHDFNQPILPPIIHIHRDVESVVVPNKILVYLPMEPAYLLPPLFSRYEGYEFYIYHPDHTEMDTRWSVGNIHKRKLSVDGFHNDFHAASGVICGAGFELTSECIHFGKKILVIPLKNQSEQTSNAHTLTLLGLGDRMDELEPGTISRWLTKQHLIKPANYPDVAESLVDWILSGEWNNRLAVNDAIHSLRTKLWSSVNSFS